MPVAGSMDAFGLDPQTRERLETFIALLRQWQSTHNLVSRSTLKEVWTRHIADSLQLLDLVNGYRTWLDLGSGAGFPGLVIAIASPEPVVVSLVESNGKKAAFLRSAIRATKAPAVVHQARIEAFAHTFHSQDQQVFDVISARALAPLSRLFELASPFSGPETTLLFPKGKDYEKEIASASQSWLFDPIDYPSKTDPDGRILEIQRIQKKV